jgi:hypothetical protein
MLAASGKPGVTSKGDREAGPDLRQIRTEGAILRKEDRPFALHARVTSMASSTRLLGLIPAFLIRNVGDRPPALPDALFRRRTGSLLVESIR